MACTGAQKSWEIERLNINLVQIMFADSHPAHRVNTMRRSQYNVRIYEAASTFVDFRAKVNILRNTQFHMT